MDRRKFLEKTLIIGGGIGLGVISTPYTIENATISKSKELEMKELLSTDILSLEKAVMTSNLLREEPVKNITDFHNKITEKSDIESKTEKIREEIIEIVINNSKKFSRKKPSNEKLKDFCYKIDNLQYEMDKIKEGGKIKFIGFKRNTIADIGGHILEFGNANLREFYQINNHLCLTELEVKNKKDEKGNLILNSTYNTLQKIAPDALFILEASKISKIPIEEIVAFANVESEGREFAIGKEGEINRFQLHPKYLKDIYKNALAQNNALSEYINENTNEGNLLEDSVRNSKLSIALAVNHILNLKKETSTYYEYILAYNRGIAGIKKLSDRTRKKLENLKNITEKEAKNPIFGYYLGYVNKINNFRKIKESII